MNDQRGVNHEYSFLHCWNKQEIYKWTDLQFVHYCLNYLEVSSESTIILITRQEELRKQNVDDGLWYLLFKLELGELWKYLNNKLIRSQSSTFIEKQIMLILLLSTISLAQSIESCFFKVQIENATIESISPVESSDLENLASTEYIHIISKCLT